VVGYRGNVKTFVKETTYHYEEAHRDKKKQTEEKNRQIRWEGGGGEKQTNKQTNKTY
jgi:hypothetical protein